LLGKSWTSFTAHNWDAKNINNQQKAFEKQQNKENQEYGANSKKEACSIDHHDLIQYTNNLARKAA